MRRAGTGTMGLTSSFMAADSFFPGRKLMKRSLGTFLLGVALTFSLALRPALGQEAKGQQ